MQFPLPFYVNFENNYWWTQPEKEDKGEKNNHLTESILLFF